MNFKFNRKPLKEKIYKWYVCGYYDINARGVEDNLTTNDVEEAKDFAWELVNRGDFVVVKNMHNGKSAIINEDDVFDDVSEYLNDIFRSIDGRTNESLKEDAVKQNNGKYNRVVKKFNSLEDAREFKSKLPKGAEARIDYFDTENKDGSVSEWWEVCYWENQLKEDISDYEIDKVYKKLSKLNKVDFGALEDEYLETKPSVKDAVYKFYGTILNTKRYCKDFVQWAKEEKGIDLKGLPCKESLQRRIDESYKRRVRESINGECYEEDLETLIDVFPVYGFHRHDFSLLVPRKQKELINTIRKRFEVPEGISIRDYVHTEIDDTRPVDDVIRDGIRDDFDYLESICDGDITPELKNLSYLNYGEDIVSEL